MMRNPFREHHSFSREPRASADVSCRATSTLARGSRLNKAAKQSIKTLFFITRALQVGELLGKLLVRIAVFRRRQGEAVALDLIILALGLHAAGTDTVKVAATGLGVGKLVVLGGRVGLFALEHLLIGLEEFAVLLLRHVGFLQHVLGNFLAEILQLQFTGLLLIQRIGLALHTGVGAVGRGASAIPPRPTAAGG